MNKHVFELMGEGGGVKKKPTKHTQQKVNAYYINVRKLQKLGWEEYFNRHEGNFFSKSSFLEFI